jgi:hypothetical protein
MGVSDRSTVYLRIGCLLAYGSQIVRFLTASEDWELPVVEILALSHMVHKQSPDSTMRSTKTLWRKLFRVRAFSTVKTLGVEHTRQGTLAFSSGSPVRLVRDSYSTCGGSI